MSPKASSHPDPIVRDLKAIRGQRWSKPEKLAEVLEVLPTHPAVRHRAAKPKGAPERIKALRHLLVITKNQLKRREDKEATQSVAVASEALLRLDAEFEEVSVEDIYRYIGEKWQMSGGTIRTHREEKDIYEPFAAGFREMARARAEKYGFDLTEDPDPDANATTKEGRLRHRLRAMERESHHRRLSAIEEGTLRIRDEDEMRGVIFALTELAEHSLSAVDYNTVADWFKPPLNEYLKLQLQRAEAGEIELERIRLVTDEELSDRGERARLRGFADLHAGAKATLLLCPRAAAEELEISFQPYRGLLLVDQGADPLAVTGKIGDGSVGRALVYTHETDEVSTIRQEYGRLKMTAKAQDELLKAQLAEEG
jgi:hypothetical protein